MCADTQADYNKCEASEKQVSHDYPRRTI